MVNFGACGWGYGLSSASNYDDVLGQLRQAGLNVDSLEGGTARPVRCSVEGMGREKRAWYSLHELPTRDGRLLLVGAYGVWQGATHTTQRVELKRDGAAALTAEQRDALRARIKRERQAAEAARRAEAARAAARAESVWRRLLPAGDSEYLRRKGVQAHGVRFAPSGAVVVPMLDVQGRVHGLQFILPSDHPRRRKTGRDKEFWPAGLAKRGHGFPIGGAPLGDAVLLLAEGYATAATLYEATGLPVVVAFDAGNLLPVAEAMAKRHKRARLLVCGDDDYLTDGNPGATSAAAAAMAVGGAHMVPEFVSDRAGRKLTDFNDLAALDGLHHVRAQVETKLRQLGWDRPGAGASSSARGGGGGDAEPADGRASFRFDLDVLLEHFTLIYGTETAFDARSRLIIGLGPLRSAAGRSLVRMWLEHPQRRTVTPDRVGFDPAGTDPSVVCNLWGGWPSSPQRGECSALLRILEHLCSREDKPREVYNWLLRWLAYPLQYPGAKMQTAPLIHGPEGTGKNTFFGAVRSTYGPYGFTFTQVELESQFNGIFSGKLFGIGNEVVSRAELYHLQGRLRNMVTEGEWPINEKNMPARMEQNHCNMIFFSNRIDIAKLDPDDRRYCVVWTPPPAAPSLYLEAKAELENGGAAALHWYLLNEVDLTGFDAHTKPPMTRAKRELIGLGMDSTERFWGEWSSEDGELRGLFTPCTSAQMYQAYTLYCRRLGIGKPAQQETLSTLVGKKAGMRLARAKIRSKGGITRQMRCVFPPGLHAPPDHVAKPVIDWLTDCVEAFDLELAELQDAGVLPYGGAQASARQRGALAEAA